MSQLHDISFDDLHQYVQAGELCSQNFVPIKIGGAACRLVAMDAAGYGQQRLIDATSASEENFPTDPKSLDKDHGFYQLYYSVERHGKNLGDLSIQLEKGRDMAWVSAWDATRQQGVELGNMPLPKENVAHALGEYLAGHASFKEHFGEIPQAAIDASVQAKSRVNHGEARKK